MPTAYDEVEYASYPYSETHPDRLRLISYLFHLEPAPIERCRVLEIGCSSGANLIPMAEALPDSRFVGFDLAASAVAVGTDAVRSLGLSNIELSALDVTGFPADAGTFDFIICHGVYSWVPPAVRGAILDLISRHLSPVGVAYVSHVVKPGYFARAAAREIMQYHTRTITDRAERLQQARAMMGFLAKAAAHPPWKPMAVEQRDHVNREPDWLLHHDYLGEIMEGCWLHEIVTDMRARGLEFLGDADLAAMLPVGVDAEARATLASLAGDPVAMQQYLDFLTFRSFRRTLVVRAGREIDRTLQRDQLRELYVTTEAREDGDKFRMPAGGEVVVGRARTRDALRVLCRRAPAALRVDELAQVIGAEGPAHDELADAILACFFEGIVELSLSPARCAGTAGERPCASGYARWAALHGRPIVNLRHEEAKIGPTLTALLPLLDGTRDRAALLTHIEPPDPETLDGMLDELARTALLKA